MQLRTFCALLLLSAAGLNMTAQAEVVDVSAIGFTSRHVLTLDADPDQAFNALTEQVAAWWDASHSYGGKAEAFSIDARPGGCFCERLSNGGFVEHMRVIHAQPGKLLVLQGGLGPLQGMGVAGSMRFELRPDEQGVQLHYQYVVGGYVAGGLQAMAEPVDGVQLGQLRRLQKYLETGQPLN